MRKDAGREIADYAYRVNRLGNCISWQIETPKAAPEAPQGAGRVLWALKGLIAA